MHAVILFSRIKIIQLGYAEILNGVYTLIVIRYLTNFVENYWRKI